jgi:hypothetical protein
VLDVKVLLIEKREFTVSTMLAAALCGQQIIENAQSDQ